MARLSLLIWVLGRPFGATSWWATGMASGVARALTTALRSRADWTVAGR